MNDNEKLLSVLTVIVRCLVGINKNSMTIAEKNIVEILIDYKFARWEVTEFGDKILREYNS
jgi:hypothetical protein